MDGITQEEMAKVQNYMRSKFGTDRLTVVARKTDDSAEVHLGGEFIGVIYKDQEDGETSFDFNMAILDIDLAS